MLRVFFELSADLVEIKRESSNVDNNGKHECPFECATSPVREDVSDSAEDVGDCLSNHNEINDGLRVVAERCDKIWVDLVNVRVVLGNHHEYDEHYNEKSCCTDCVEGPVHIPSIRDGGGGYAEEESGRPTTIRDEFQPRWDNIHTISLFLNPPGNDRKGDADEQCTRDESRSEDNVLRIFNSSVGDISEGDRFNVTFSDSDIVGEENACA